MFQYTREFIINEDIKLNADDIKDMVAMDGIATYQVGNDETGMKRILNLVEQAYKDPEPATITVPFTTNATKLQRLVVIIGLYRSTEASYANAAKASQERQFQFEIPAKYTLDQAVAVINKSLSYSDHKYCVVTKDSTTGIKITGVNGYQRISAKLFVSDGINTKHEESWTETKDILRKDGYIGNGTYELLMQNNRLATIENTKYFSINKYEMPVPGVKYDLVEFMYNSGIRNIGGSGVVGSLERSMTKHRFWINSALIVKAADEIAAIASQTTNIGKAIAMLKANAVAADIPEVKTGEGEAENPFG